VGVHESSKLGEFACARNDLLEHLGRESARLGVIAAAVIRVDQMFPGPEGVLTPVPEGKIPPLEPSGQKHGLMSDAPQSQDHTKGLELPELDLKVRIAATDLIREWLIGRRHAFD
jgi:hypothetical protein